MMDVKKADWWEPSQNDLDEDIEQLSKAPGGGGCCVRVTGTLVASLAVFLFLFLI